MAKPPLATAEASAKGSSGAPHPPDAHRPAEAPAEGAEDKETLIEKMFGGKLSTGIRCMQCASVSEKEEPFTDLSLAFCPSATGQRPLAEGLQPEGGAGGADGGKAPGGALQGPVSGGSEALDGPIKEKQAGLNGAAPTAERPAHDPPLSVPDLINYFLAPEILDEDNKYYCETCASLQRAEKTMEVVQAPEYLILTLLRFSYDAKFHVRRKILDNVCIPPVMQLPVHRRAPAPGCPSSPLQVDSPDSGENLAKKLKPSGKEEEEEEAGRRRSQREEAPPPAPPPVRAVPYVLSSVVMHSGMSSESGHYYCYGRNVSGSDGGAEAELAVCGSLSGQEAELLSQPARDWFLFNDSRVTFTSLPSVQNVTSRFPKDTAYVLIYRKQELRALPAGGGPNGLRLNSEPPLQKELMDAITKDNKLFLQVRAGLSMLGETAHREMFGVQLTLTEQIWYLLNSYVILRAITI